jgi:hypothetical protein
MGQEKGRLARLVLTDPPYNVPIVGNVTKGKHLRARARVPK